MTQQEETGATQTAEQEQPPQHLREADLIILRVRLLARLRNRWLRHLWAEGMANAGSMTALDAEVEFLLDNRDTPIAEAEWRKAQPEYQGLEAVSQQLVVLRGRLHQLRSIFGLTDAEIDVMQAVLAVTIDPAVGRVCAYLQDHRGRGFMTESLVGQLFGYGGGFTLNAESPLLRWELVIYRPSGTGEAPSLMCDPHIGDWVLGEPSLDHLLVGHARLQECLPPLASWPVGELVAMAKQVMQGESPGRLRLLLQGQQGSGRRTLAACVAEQLRLPLLTIDADAIDDHEWRRVFMRAQRQAFLDRCALAWVGESLTRRPWPDHIAMFPLQFVIVDGGQTVPRANRTAERRVEMPALTRSDRQHLWRHHLPVSAAWSREEWEALSQQRSATPGEIAHVALTRTDNARDAQAMVRELSRDRLGQLAQVLECPFEWDDLVLPSQLKAELETIVFEAQIRDGFWERAEPRRLFPQGRALLALFSGPPGTGKTMAAQIIAARLGRDLYRIDLSAVVSKWVGETAQHLERLLSRAKAMDAVLFFDEADAIYGKRVQEIRDAQDRFANMDVSHLMVAIENYDGIVILASNLKSNIDAAFLRRIRHTLEFPKPGEQERLTIWNKVLTSLTDRETVERLTPSLVKLAKIEASGAQIKYGALAAVWLAEQGKAPLEIDHLVRGLNRELAKEGAALSARDRAGFVHGQ